jgi:small subunit ribosomal protein S20
MSRAWFAQATHRGGGLGRRATASNPFRLLDPVRDDGYKPRLPPQTLSGGPPTQTEAHRTGIMANTASARKRIRQSLVRTARNAARKSRMRTFVKKVEAAIASGDKAVAVDALRSAQPEMQRASGKGVIHANTVARKLSRLSARIKALASA